jgi:DNA repair exonuclease SbcCD ATPase subunit
MHDYKRAIGELQKGIAKNSAETRDCLRKLGEVLSYKEAETLSGPAMKELYDRIQELRRELPESRQQVKKILQTVAGNEALEREIRAKRQQISELTKKNDGICESIGRAAYLAYQSLPVSGKEHEELFESLEKQEQALAELEAEEQTLQERGKGGKFFKIFRESGRSVYVKGLLSLRRKAADKTYHEVGRQICSSPELKEQLEDRRLLETLAPFEANERQISAVQRELDQLLADQEKKWSELKTLGAHRSHQKRVREIETDIQRIEAKMQDEFEALGTLFRNKRSAEVQDPEAAGLLHQMLEIEQDTRKKEKRIERLKAALEIDGLENQLGNLSDRIARLEGDIEERRREVETLREQIAAGEKEIQRLQRIRGSKQSLLEEQSNR